MTDYCAEHWRPVVCVQLYWDGNWSWLNVAEPQKQGSVTRLHFRCVNVNSCEFGLQVFLWKHLSVWVTRSAWEQHVTLFISSWTDQVIDQVIDPLWCSSSVGDFPSFRCGLVAMVTRAPAAGRAPQWAAERRRGGGESPTPRPAPDRNRQPATDTPETHRRLAC